MGGLPLGEKLTSKDLDEASHLKDERTCEKQLLLGMKANPSSTEQRKRKGDEG